MRTKPLGRIISLTIMLVIFALPVFTQKAPIKFGNIEKAALEMSVYPADTSAQAVILCDYGYFSSTSFNFTRILRIKILKKEGLEWANRSFPTSEKTTVKGITYNLVNGEVTETKLKSESVFVEKITEDKYRTRVAMPNVSVGSVIDLQFTRPWLPPDWYFQESIPVILSELVIEESPYIQWRKNYFGFVSLAENSRTRWVAMDVPAFKSEPYTANSTNFLSKFTIEVLSISIPPSSTSSGFYREYSTTWEAVNNQLQQDDDFGLAIQGCMFLNSKVKEIQEKYTAPMDKLIAAHEYIKQNLKWNENEALYISEQSLSDAWDLKLGNSADVNLLLIQMLKKLDFKVLPVVLSTRSNGFLSPLYPSLDQLNYVVAYVWIDDKPYFVDATEENLPVGLLPVRCLNLQGRIISDDASTDWIDLVPSKKNKKVTQAELTITPELVMTGNILRYRYDYSALNFRNDYEEYNSEDDFLRDEESENQGLSILNAGIFCLDSLYVPVRENYEVKIRNRITKVGNQLYLYPLLFEQVTENPFKPEERLCPVDFIYPSEVTYVCKYILPENAKIVEMPKPGILKLPDNSLSMQYQISNSENTVFLTYKFSITRPNFSIDEYHDMRAFFSELIKKHAEPVIFEL